MKDLEVKNVNELRNALSNLKSITVYLLLFELQEYRHVLFEPKLLVRSQAYDSHYDFDTLGQDFLHNQFCINSYEEKLIYKRQSDREVYGYVFCHCNNFNSFKEKNTEHGNVLGVIYMKE